MSDYTPPIDEVREFWIWGGTPDDNDERADEFDRWLAAHDAEVRADEREKVAEAVAEALERTYGWHPDEQAVAIVAAARGDGEQA